MMTQSNELIFFIDLDNTIWKNPYPLIFNEIIDELSAKTERSLDFVFSLINYEFEIREKQNRIFTFDWDDILSCVCRKIGDKWDCSLTDYINKHINKYGINVFQGVESALKILKKENVKLYCSSNGFYKYQEPILKATGLMHLFDELITSDQVGFTKSSKKFYRDKFIDEKRVITIGDSYKYDVFYPKKFGFNSIWDVETILSPSIVKKYLYSVPSERSSLINHEFLTNHKSDIYSQNCTLSIMPDAIIFKFFEIINSYKIIISDTVNTK